MMTILEKLINALRDELQQYGEMLALLDHQENIGRHGNPGDLLLCLSALSAQSAVIHRARQQRQSLQQRLAQALPQTVGASFAHLLPHFPEQYRVLAGALVQENNELLLRVRQRAEQNQLLLLRSAEMMQHFVASLASQDRAAAAAEPGDPQPQPQGGSLYEAIA